MTLFSIRSSRTRPPRACQKARLARTTFLPVASELEGRALLSTLTVLNGRDSGPGSLVQEVALAISGDTITFSPALASQTIHLTSPLNFNGSLSFDGSRAGGCRSSIARAWHSMAGAATWSSTICQLWAASTSSAATW